jgi:hypothetical protein
MYVNPFTAEFNPHRHYAFLRKHENELMLIVANFDGWDTPMSVNIPSAAFDYFKLPTLHSIEATELLTGEKVSLALHPDAPVRLTVPGFSGAIVKITLPEKQ